MEPTIARSDDEILSCMPAMRALRQHIGEALFLPRIRAQQAAGYQLVFAGRRDTPEAVAGFRILENLAWGRFLYVDDLVTLPVARSSGLGAQLLDWLKAHARREGCAALHLDSGVQRHDAHRFYEREGMQRSSYHFSVSIEA